MSWLAWLALGLCAYSSAISSLNPFNEFVEFTRKFNKPYSDDSEEFWYRYAVFKANLLKYDRLNELHKNGTKVYGVNKFSDLTDEEFRKMYLRDIPPSPFLNQNATVYPDLHLAPAPDKWDWRDKNIITAIKNQQSCGACWAFCTVETVESMHAKASGQLSDLSVQEVIDCAHNTYGCSGGDTCTALAWMVDMSVPMLTESEYPLLDKDEACRLQPLTKTGVKVQSYSCQGYVGNENMMVDLLYNFGPLVVTVDASTWNNYAGGIIQYHCMNYLNHAVQVVGYDRTGDIPYYIVRNSWGTDFGDNGYLYIKIGGDLCGIATQVSTVTTAE